MTATVTSQASVLPAGTANKIELSGETLQLDILYITGENAGVLKEDGTPEESENDNVGVQFPDGFFKFFQIKDGDMAALLAQISGTVKGRYNVSEFTFAEGAEFKAPSMIQLTGVKY